ncbi:hypothetical protein LTS18_003244, partial [Coniosporium uncinatum]
RKKRTGEAIGPLASRDHDASNNQLRTDALRSAEERLVATEKDRKVRNAPIAVLLMVVLFVPLPGTSLEAEAQQTLLVVWLLFGVYDLFTHN